MTDPSMDSKELPVESGVPRLRWLQLVTKEPEGVPNPPNMLLQDASKGGVGSIHGQRCFCPLLRMGQKGGAGKGILGATEGPLHGFRLLD